jgi:D-3-phosphoglycerate dehydrogenase
MLVLIADKLPAHAVSALRDLGAEVVARPELKADTLPAALEQTGARVLIVRSTQVTAAALAASDTLELVIRAGAGTNTIDVAAATERKIAVANTPGKNGIAVAELAMGLILALDRRLPDAVADMRQGRWRKSHYGKAMGLHGRRLGIVGFGSIGREVAKRAQGFGMHVGAFDVVLDDATARQYDVHRYAQVEELFAEADVVTVHVPYNTRTKRLVNAAMIGKMKPGALLVHTARGGVVDDAALIAAVKEGRIRAALDVYEDEPTGGDDPYEGPTRDVEGLYGTPHIGASTEQAQDAVAEETIAIVKGFLDNGVVANLVNVEIRTRV